MKINFDFNEKEILEKILNENYSLTNSVIFEIKKIAVDETVQSIKKKIVDVDFYGGEKDYFKEEIQKEVFNAIKQKIENLIKDKFSDVSLETMLEKKVNNIFDEFIEKRIFLKLEKAKADLQFYFEKEDN